MTRSAEASTTHPDYLHELNTDHLDALIGSNATPAGRVEPEGRVLA